MELKPVRVLVVDDSLVAREMLVQILSSDPGIEVLGTAPNGQAAIAMTAALRPDLITMDIHMPVLDGLAATEQIMAFTPTPILVVSSSVYGEGMGRAFDALESGALEVIKKPEPAEWADLERIGRDVIRRVKLLSRVRVITHVKGKRAERMNSRGLARDGSKRAAPQLIAIGSSTGGPSALLNVLSHLPADTSAPIVVAQHITEGFIPGLVNWLDSGCKLKVVAANDGEEALPGQVYFAPTGLNLTMDGTMMRFTVREPGQLYIPSADTLFSSVAHSLGARALGIILTGMGSDGALGLKAMRDAGAVTIAQDEATSIVYGMPQAAVEAGGACAVLPIQAIGQEIERVLAEA